tara:strand:- start:398 stop:622 length:225 start_codon:yes stop_codon:yes gene_type:complete
LGRNYGQYSRSDAIAVSGMFGAVTRKLRYFFGGAVAFEPTKGTGNTELIQQFLKIHFFGLDSRFQRRRLLKLGL